VSSLAKDFKASPALAANAIRATQLIGGDVSHIKLALCSILKTIDGSFDRPIDDSSKYSYDEGLINTNIKLSELTQTLSQPKAYPALRSVFRCRNTGRSSFYRRCEHEP